MKGEDWTTGIDHEAQSVNDPVWAAQARRLAQRQRFWASVSRVVLAVALLEAGLLLLNVLMMLQGRSFMISQPWFTTEAAWRAFGLSSMALTYSTVGIVLGLCRVSPRLVVPLALAYPLFQLITTVLVPRPDKPFPGSPLEAADPYPRLEWMDLGPWMATPWFRIQLAVAGLGVWVGIHLGARWRVARTLARA